MRREEMCKLGLGQYDFDLVQERGLVDLDRRLCGDRDFDDER